MAAALVVLAVIVVVLAVLVLGYNGLVRQRDRVDSAWSQVDLQLRRRSELIPSLVETVDDHAGYERGTLEAVTEARARAIGAHGPVEQASAESALTGALMSLFAVVESYPDLRASQGFPARALWSCSGSCRPPEDRAAYARQYYNDAVLTYNNAVTTAPRRILAAVFKFRTREHFQTGGEELGPVRV